ncbi:uncharacterized protein B4U79_14579 [Dinothrombium tinctorium]|uniref:Uncharacterized protein n=1 Tax=Dinothrombium tinctorium TaxID=1965070 RepID=A0A443R7J8_9ACAR|nr:uncharacterized protein B4U79_14579 [Dinothrombium tinctorium]
MDGPCSDIPNSSSVNDLDFSDSSAHTISDAGAFVYIEGADGVPSENSTAAILHFCKLKVLKPYFRLLSVLGWRPILYQWRPFEHHIFVKLINWTYTLLVMSLIICGYVLQYMTCYRHDGFPSDSFSPVAKVPGDKFNTVIKNEMSYLMPNYSQENENHLVVGDEKRELIAANSSSGERNLCPGNLIALYVLPDLLHFIAYLLVLYVMRNPESERSENLMERSFLQTSRTTN